MDDLNSVIMIGRLAFDPEIKVSTTGKTKAKIRIAIGRGKDAKGKDKGAYFFNCQAYGKTAVAIGKYATKGRRINIQGKLCEWKYDKDGETRTYTVINIDVFRFLDSPKTNGADRSGADQAGAPVETFDDSSGKRKPMNGAGQKAMETGGPGANTVSERVEPDDDIPF